MFLTSLYIWLNYYCCITWYYPTNSVLCFRVWIFIGETICFYFSRVNKLLNCTTFFRLMIFSLEHLHSTSNLYLHVMSSFSIICLMHHRTSGILVCGWSLDVEPCFKAALISTTLVFASPLLCFMVCSSGLLHLLVC